MHLGRSHGEEDSRGSRRRLPTRLRHPTGLTCCRGLVKGDYHWPSRVLPVEPPDWACGTAAAPRKVWVWRLGAGLEPCGFMTGGVASGWTGGAMVGASGLRKLMRSFFLWHRGVAILQYPIGLASSFSLYSRLSIAIYGL